jgi:CRISPR/Cas system-associated exonuclease Cas4 (RecB family)
MRISISKINTFLEDPRKYWYIYEMGIQTPKSEGFYFGSAIHEGLENYYSGKDPMQGVSKALFGKKKSLGEEVREGVDLHKLYTQARKIFDVYEKKAPEFKPLFVEHWFEVDLIHPITREKLPATFVGKIDLITTKGELVDHKTSSGYDSSYYDFPNWIQSTGYAYAYLQTFDKFPKSFIFNEIIKGNSRREPWFKKKVLKPDLKDICKFFDITEDVLGKISRGETKDYPSAKHSRVCPCKDICPYCNGELTVKSI